MIIPRPTKLAPSSSILASIQPKMKIRKVSIPSSFISICWFSSLFAICLFSFLYLYPRDNDNCINNIIKINNDSEKTLTISSKYLSNETIVDGFTIPIINNVEAKSNDTVIEPLISNVEVKFNDTVIELPTSNDFAPNEQSSNSTIVEVVDQTPPAIEETSPVIKETPPPIEETSPVIKETPPTIEKAPSAIEETSPVIKEIPPAIEEETDQEYNTIPSYDVFSNPPWNCTREERILWLKEKLEESKLVKSTTRTQNFEAKIQSFFNKQGNNIIPCRVRIFLTWTYPANLFGNRELLVLESILKAHYDGCVVILSKTMDSKPGWSILQPILDRGHRVLPVNPDYHYLFSNTPAQAWLERLESGDIDPGTVPLTLNLSNLLRLVVLYKYGGVYFDNDVIILKPVSSLRNTIGIQSVDHHKGTWSTMSSGVLIFDKEHPLLWKFMEEFAWNFDGFKWGFNGPDLVTRVVAKALNDSNFEFHIMVPLAFYPVDWVRINRLFEKPNKKGPFWAQGKFGEISAESYGVHLWNRQTRNLKIEKKSVIDRLISSHCIICQNVYDS